MLPQPPRGAPKGMATCSSLKGSGGLPPTLLQSPQATPTREVPLGRPGAPLRWREARTAGLR